ncbi:NYN domain-containing protein, partial [Micromonospora endophytica]
GQRGEGVGSHWWKQLTAADFQTCQLSDPAASPAGTYARPSDW